MAYYNCQKCNALMHVRHYKVNHKLRRPICFYCYKNLSDEELAYFNEEPITEIDEINHSKVAQWPVTAGRGRHL